MPGWISQGDLDAMAGVVNDCASNAVLVKIQGPGAPDRSGDPNQGPVVWEGEARGFLARERHDEVSGGVQVPVRRDVFTLLDEVAPALMAAGPDWEASTVTVRDERGEPPVDVVFMVTGMEHTAHGLLDSVLLTLDEVGV